MHPFLHDTADSEDHQEEPADFFVTPPVFGAVSPFQAVPNPAEVREASAVGRAGPAPNPVEQAPRRAGQPPRRSAAPPPRASRSRTCGSRRRRRPGGPRAAGQVRLEPGCSSGLTPTAVAAHEPLPLRAVVTDQRSGPASTQGAQGPTPPPIPQVFANPLTGVRLEHG